MINAKLHCETRFKAVLFISANYLIAVVYCAIKFDLWNLVYFFCEFENRLINKNDSKRLTNNCERSKTTKQCFIITKIALQFYENIHLTTRAKKLITISADNQFALFKQTIMGDGVELIENRRC